MANLQHSTLSSASVHEPKHITINGVASSGKVITNSASSAGQSEYRKLSQADLEGLEVIYTIQEFDGTISQTHYLPTTFNGTIDNFQGVVNTAVAGGTNTYGLQIDGVSVTNSALSFTTSPGTGGTAGDVVETNPSGANIFSAGQVITIVRTATANTEANLDIRFVITVTRG